MDHLHIFSLWQTFDQSVTTGVNWSVSQWSGIGQWSVTTGINWSVSQWSGISQWSVTTGINWSVSQWSGISQWSVTTGINWSVSQWSVTTGINCAASFLTKRCFGFPKILTTSRIIRVIIQKVFYQNIKRTEVNYC